MDIRTIFKEALRKLVCLPEIRTIIKKNLIYGSSQGGGNEVRIYPFLNKLVMDEIRTVNDNTDCVYGIGYERVGNRTQEADCSLILENEGRKRYCLEIKGPSYSRPHLNGIDADIGRLRPFIGDGDDQITGLWGCKILINNGSKVVEDFSSVPVVIYIKEQDGTEMNCPVQFIDLTSVLPQNPPPTITPRRRRRTQE